MVQWSPAARRGLNASQLDVIAIKRKGRKREQQLILMHKFFLFLFRSFFSDIFQVFRSLLFFLFLSLPFSFYICGALKNTSQLCELCSMLELVKRSTFLYIYLT